MKKKDQKKKAPLIAEINPYAAGIDIGATEIWVAVNPEHDDQSIRKFTTFTQDLHKIADWLISCCVKTVAMESTGVYWIPLFQILETRGLNVCIVNAQHLKSVPGRDKKSDVADCQWLQYLHSMGLLSGSFRPEDQVCELRSILRHRDNLIQESAKWIQIMQKALTQMNIQLHNVISDISGVSGLAIIDAILDGERDLLKLAQMCDRRIKASIETIVKSLEGDYRTEHLFCLAQARESYAHFQKQMDQCDIRIKQLLAKFQLAANQTQSALCEVKKRKYRCQGNQPRFDVAAEMQRVCGVDLSAIPGISGQTLLALCGEMGPQFYKRFPSIKHFCSWLGLCPNNRISGGKILSSRTRKVSCRFANALRLAASTLVRSKTELGDYYRRIRAKLGAPAAITAAAHKLARIIYAMLRDASHYDPQRQILSNQKRQSRREHLIRQQAKALGYDLIPSNKISPIYQNESHA